jgi:hypothetical protein
MNAVTESQNLSWQQHATFSKPHGATALKQKSITQRQCFSIWGFGKV